MQHGAKNSFAFSTERTFCTLCRKLSPLPPSPAPLELSVLPYSLLLLYRICEKCFSSDLSGLLAHASSFLSVSASALIFVLPLAVCKWSHPAPALRFVCAFHGIFLLPDYLHTSLFISCVAAHKTLQKTLCSVFSLLHIVWAWVFWFHFGFQALGNVAG